MPIQIIGSSGTVANVDGTTWRALRVTVRPVEYGLLGQYRLGTRSPDTTSVTYTAESVFQARWGDPNAVALIWGLSIRGFSYTNKLTNARFGNFQLFMARNYTANGSGGTVFTPLLNQDLRMTMRQSRMTDMRIAIGVPLTDGTWILDSQPVGQCVFSTTNVVIPSGAFNIIGDVSIFGRLSRFGNTMPLLLDFNSGIDLIATMQITGTSVKGSFGLEMAWSEVAIY
jgi:hypothetical protein